MEVGGVAPRVLGQAQGVHRGIAVFGEEGADGGRRHREFPPAEGDSPHGEEVGDLLADSRGRGRGLKDVECAALTRRRCPEGEECSVALPLQPRGSLEDQDAPRGGAHQSGEPVFRLLSISCRPFSFFLSLIRFVRAGSEP